MDKDRKELKELSEELKRIMTQEMVGGIFFEEALLVFEAQDLNLEQYMEAAGAIQNAIQCYQVIYEKTEREKKELLLRHQSWIIKKAKLQRIDTFELWCWGRLLRVPWTAKSNQSILKEINPEYSLKRLMLKLKLQYFSHLM